MKSTHKIIAMVVLAALIVGVALTASFWAFNQVKEAAEAREHINLVIGNADNLLSTLKDAETGERGYLLTGDETFLEPYSHAKRNITADFNKLRLQTKIQSAQQYLGTIGPLVDAKMADLSRLIELSRNEGHESAAAEVRKGRGKHLMDSIRTELSEFTKVEKSSAAQLEIKLQSTLRHMFNIIIIAGILWALFALAFIYLFYRQSQQKLKNLVHLETKHLLEIQEDTNIKLQQTNVTLRDSEEQLAVTLNSIGDAVIATNTEARITRLNPVAEHLTGWMQAEAVGRTVDEVFHIINKESRQPSTIPVLKTLEHGVIQGLANHTVLVARDGSECDIADSCAPILSHSGEVIGAVLVFRDVTEEYKIQQTLRDSTAQMQAILNTVVDGVITFHARNGLVETINPAAEKMFGFSTAELIGLNFSVLIPELDQNQRDGSLEHYRASDEALAAGIGREVIGWRKGNIPFPLEIAVSEMWLGGERYFTGILRDITLRKETEGALLKAGALQNAIFNSANFSSIATDAKGVIQIFNVGAEHMLGYTATDVMNKITPAEISDPEEVVARAKVLSLELDTTIKPGFEALVFKASRGIEDIYELTYIRKDGSRLPAVVSVTALRDAQNTIIGYLLIGTDNTARKLIEAERIMLNEALQDKNTELELATIVAENANLAKSDFLSSMSHELRTPLGAILGFAQLIESGTPMPTPTQKKSIDQILKAGWYLLDLINEILDLALIESGKMALSLEPVSLTEVMRECEAMIEPQAQKRDIKINFSELETPYFVKADHTRVKQIILNLLSNAIKYNKVAGTVDVEYALTDADSIHISIRDTGEGLSPELIDQLFQPFNRLGQNAKSEVGTGIGLVVCKRLIELMDGKIGVESTVGKGSVFWIELNLIIETRLENQANTNVPDHVQNQDKVQLYTLLYVEDNPANLMLVEDIIARRNDISLLTAKDGKQGIKMARTALPDLILMDINLPGISGLDAMKILAKDSATAHIPVIALSANAIPRDIEKGLQAGFFRYLTKPIKVIEFMDTLDLALEFAKKQATLAAEKE